MICLPEVENWYRLNEELGRSLALPEGVAVRSYKGLHHAAFELAQSTASFFSHKRSVGFLKGQTHAFDTTLPTLYKEAFQVQPHPQKAPPADLVTWAAQLKKDTSFVMMCEDHPVTSELFDCTELEKSLNEKKIFSIKVSHRKHLFQPISEPLPHSVLICDYGPEFALAVLGLRFKSPIQISHHLHFEMPAVLEMVKNQRAQTQTDAALVQSFEKSLPEPFRPYFQNESRLMDRSLIVSETLNAEAVVSFLESRLGPLQAWPLTNCHWKNQDYEWWEGHPRQNVLRGVMVLGLETIKKPELPGLLKEAVKECRI